VREGRRVRSPRVARLAPLLLLLLAAPVPVASEPEQGIGGTGLEEPQDLGEAGMQDPEDGIGGTGLQGLPGSIVVAGLYGTVTGLGPVVVNGTPVSVDAARVGIDWDGAPTAGDVVVGAGQVVWVQGELDGKILTAASMSIVSAVAGPVTELDVGTKSVELLGQQVELAPDAVVHDRIADLLQLAYRAALTEQRETPGLDFASDYLARTPRDVLDPPELIDGADLQQMGLPPGPRFKEILTAVRDAQLNEEITTPDDALALARKLIDE